MATKHWKERRELSAGATKREAIENYFKWLPAIDGPTTHAKVAAFDPEKHECIKDEKSGMWQVFNKRKPKYDRTIRKPIIRESVDELATFGSDRRRIMLIIGNGTLGLFLKGRRRKNCKTITWRDLYVYLAQKEGIAKANARRAQKASAKKAKAYAKKLERQAVMK